MKNHIYAVRVEIPFSPKAVFDHINDISKWWPEAFEGKSAELNDEFIFRSGEDHYSKQKVIEFVQDKKVVWLVTGSMRKPDNYEWTGTKYIFELTSLGNKTLLAFTYDGPVPENEYDRLTQVCDMVIKEKLFNFIADSKSP